MSDDQAKPEDQAAPPPPTKTNNARLVILLLVFGIALAGLLYDYCIARPAVEAAYAKVDSMLKGENDRKLSVTANEVQKELKREPSKTEDLENGHIEIYSWRSGLPTRVYSLYVVYTGRKQPLLYAASQNKRPKDNQLPPKTGKPTPMPDGFVRPQPSAMGGGGRARKPKRGNRKMADTAPDAGKAGEQEGKSKDAGEAESAQKDMTSTDAAKQPEPKTDPETPSDTDAAKKDDTDPGKKDEAEPAKKDDTDPGKKDEAEPAKKDDADPGKKDEAEPAKKDDTDPGKKDETEPAKKDDTDPGKKDDAEAKKDGT